MRVNVYAEEMTDRVEIISKKIEGQAFTGLRLFLELPVTTHTNDNGKPMNVRGPFVHRPGDDDSAAITFWGKQDLRWVLRKSLAMLDDHYAGRRSSLESILQEIATERRRQTDALGWTPQHDDEHQSGELALAAASYAISEAAHVNANQDDYADTPPEMWPWHPSYWNPKDPRRDLVRAGALIVAELERLDRAKPAEGGADA